MFCVQGSIHLTKKYNVLQYQKAHMNTDEKHSIEIRCIRIMTSNLASCVAMCNNIDLLGNFHFLLNISLRKQEIHSDLTMPQIIIIEPVFQKTALEAFYQHCRKTTSKFMNVYERMQKWKCKQNLKMLFRTNIS